MLKFLRIPPFAVPRMFDYWITSALTKNAPDGFRRLRKLVSATCLRRTKDLLQTRLPLPNRVDLEEQIHLGHEDRALYDFFRLQAASILSGLLSATCPNTPSGPRGNVLAIINFLRMICNHGEKLLPRSAVQIYRDRHGSQPATVSFPQANHCCAGCGTDSNPYADFQHRVGFPTEGDTIKPTGTAFCQPCQQIPQNPSPDNSSPSAKVARLIDNIRKEQQQNSTTTPTEPPVKR